MNSTNHGNLLCLYTSGKITKLSTTSIILHFKHIHQNLFRKPPYTHPHTSDYPILLIFNVWMRILFFFSFLLKSFRGNATQRNTWDELVRCHWCLWRMTNENWRSASHRNTICSWLLFLCGWHMMCDARILLYERRVQLNAMLCGLGSCCWVYAIIAFIISNCYCDWNKE